MTYHRERPICRLGILTLLKNYNCTLEQLLFNSDVLLSPSLRKQAHKMLQEGQFRTALDIYKEVRQEKIMRNLGMIK